MYCIIDQLLILFDQLIKAVGVPNFNFNPMSSFYILVCPVKLFVHSCINTVVASSWASSLSRRQRISPGPLVLLGPASSFATPLSVIVSSHMGGYEGP